MKRALMVAGLTFGLMAGAAGVQASEDAIEYRKAVFQAIGGHMSALVKIVRQEVPHTEDIAVHADGIADLAPLVEHIFPEGSDRGRTDALARIWEDTEGFAQRQQAFINAAEDARAAAGGSMREFVGAFQELGRSCQGCHDNYRAD